MLSKFSYFHYWISICFSLGALTVTEPRCPKWVYKTGKAPPHSDIFLLWENQIQADIKKWCSVSDFVRSSSKTAVKFRDFFFFIFFFLFKMYHTWCTFNTFSWKLCSPLQPLLLNLLIKDHNHFCSQSPFPFLSISPRTTPGGWGMTTPGGWRMTKLTAFVLQHGHGGYYKVSTV